VAFAISGSSPRETNTSRCQKHLLQLCSLFISVNLKTLLMPRAVYMGNKLSIYQHFKIFPYLLHIPLTYVHSAVGIATDYGLNDHGIGVRVSVGSRIFVSPCRPNRLWGPSNLLTNGYRRPFSRGQSGRGVKLNTHHQLVPRSRRRGSILSLPHTPSWCRA
jgi:hypothetical protein